MARRCLFIIVVILSAAIFFCCTDDETVVNSSSHPLVIGNLVNFDTTVPIMVEIFDPSRYPIPEPERTK